MKLAAVPTLLALVASAAADVGHADVEVRVVKTLSATRRIEATIAGAPLLPLDRYALVDQHHTRIAASELKPFDALESVAIVLLVAGSEVMIGNTTIEADDSPARHHGYLAGIKAGITALDLAHMPVGSKGMLITYEDAAHIRVPMVPIAELEPDAIGSERDAYYRNGSALVTGIELALAELANVSAQRKVLIVIGDGNDTNNETATPSLRHLKARAAQLKIATYGVIYKGELSEPGDVISQMIHTATTVPTSDSIAPALTAIRARLAERYILTFPGERLQWGTRFQPVSVEIAGERLDPVQLDAGFVAEPAPGYNPFARWWFQLAMGLGAVGAIALVMRRRARR